MINNIWILIGKKLNGEASPEELLELEQLLQQQGDAIMYPMDKLEEIWKNDQQIAEDEKLLSKWAAFDAELDAVEEKEAEEAAQVIAVQTKKEKARIIKLGSLLAAACLMLGVFWFTRKETIVPGKPNEITAPKNGISKIQLPDGSRVWLNMGSKLTYNNDFGTEQRKVSLVGEAFFDVVKDPQRPFVVTTTTISIRVLGTKFNVRSYNNDKTSEAALIRGKIELTILKNPEKKIILNPSEKITVINNQEPQLKSNTPTYKIAEETPLIALSRIHQAKEDTLPSEALWLENKLAFDAEDFENIAQKMERRYNVNIVFENEDIKKLRFTGKFEKESINKALLSLQKTAAFHYKIDTNQIVIY
ncbi:FecR family protein [Mucilaginibacter rubeus]|uniref:FecR family protein n=1 Tax=Mucilaginibacter rubeus TaxID=2027860 RepID=A0AAE6MIK2_9SPHI|nr:MULTISPECIES: FecR family protein [Mucilaginibacter]QEM04731.1 FecR family protein [Mucilaginibacter rubeus]QEM17325.1 FecR family protein [Mucilaginibacter gossypii]QTE46160.1 FecR family protein [Mucilaginibacter rubeus]QTE52758.1 FecR family protein [Mucilaginibacter rubeus]QTE57845.1 FecR family protein [Mucilaginibacter rubeus]